MIHSVMFFQVLNSMFHQVILFQIKLVDGFDSGKICGKRLCDPFIPHFDSFQKQPFSKGYAKFTWNRSSNNDEEWQIHTPISENSFRQSSNLFCISLTCLDWFLPETAFFFCLIHFAQIWNDAIVWFKWPQKKQIQRSKRFLDYV